MTQVSVVDLEEFPWCDPADTGYELDAFDPERDTAPDGEGYPWCDGHGPEPIQGVRALAVPSFAAPNGALLGWGPGWPTGVPADELVVVVCGANGIRLPTRRQIAPLVAGRVLELEAARRKEGRSPFRPEWCWGYANRPIAGTSTPSNHSRGTADDLDAPENPYLPASLHAADHPLRRLFPGSRLLRSTMPYDTQAIAERWGFFWGGLYATKPDPMHFECALTPLRAAQLITDLRALDGRTAMNEDQQKHVYDTLGRLELRLEGLAQLVKPLFDNDAAALRRMIHKETRGALDRKDLIARIRRRVPAADAEAIADEVLASLADKLGPDEP